MPFNYCFRGMLDSTMSGRGLTVFNLTLLSPNIDASDKVADINTALGELGESVHIFLGDFVIAILALHIAAALKHHVFHKDDTLKKMLGK